MRSLFVLLTLALGLGPLALPATAAPDEDEILAALESDDPATVAWAAWDAAEAGLARAAPRVAARLADTVGEDAPIEAAYGNLMDAAIRLGAVPDVRTIEALAREAPKGTAVLLCRQVYRDPDSALVAYDALRAGGVGWIAVGNTLAGHRVPGLAARLLTELEMFRRVQIRDVPPAPRPPPSGHVTWSGFGRRPDGFPPVVHYTLSLGETDSLLSGGAHPVYVSRLVFEEQKYLFGGITERMPEAHGCRVGWLDTMLDREPPCPLWARDSLGLRHVGRQPFQREIGRITNDLYARYWAWAHALVERGLLTEAEARTLTPVVRFEVRDERQDRRHALPEPEIPAPQNPWLARASKSARRSV